MDVRQRAFEVGRDVLSRMRTEVGFEVAHDADLGRRCAAMRGKASQEIGFARQVRATAGGGAPVTGTWGTRVGPRLHIAVGHEFPTFAPYGAFGSRPLAKKPRHGRGPSGDALPQGAGWERGLFIAECGSATSGSSSRGSFHPAGGTYSKRDYSKILFTSASALRSRAACTGYRIRGAFHLRSARLSIHLLAAQASEIFSILTIASAWSLLFAIFSAFTVALILPSATSTLDLFALRDRPRTGHRPPSAPAPRRIPAGGCVRANVRRSVPRHCRAARPAARNPAPLRTAHPVK